MNEEIFMKLIALVDLITFFKKEKSVEEVFVLKRIHDDLVDRLNENEKYVYSLWLEKKLVD